MGFINGFVFAHGKFMNSKKRLFNTFNYMLKFHRTNSLSKKSTKYYIAQIDLIIHFMLKSVI